ncbi:MAG TPA: HAD family hydrolase [Clostridiales bacterium]|nr:HAD family hydrolase [Clostridiales bacterium]
MQYDTIIFDLDGTLLNTLEDLRDSLNAILIQNGFPQRSLEEVRRFVGNGVKTLIRLSVPDTCSDEQVEQLLIQFKEHYGRNMQNKTRPYDGIMELLLDLQRFNYKLGIVSNKFDAAVKSLAKTYFGDLIPIAIGETDQVKRKPAPDSVFEAMRQLGSDPKQTIYVGDSETDVRTAKNAGLPCIGVTWGFRSRQVLRDEGADYLIDTPKELLTLI